MQKEYILGIIIILLVGVGLAVLFFSSDSSNSINSSLDKNGNKGKPYIEIVNPSGFVNTDDKPIKIADYIGKKVILLDIMTYSCINCQRTFPHITEWYEKYKDEGFIIIGIHTPEFAFEKNKKNVENAMREFGINFPVVLDNDYGTWNAYGNRYWPRKYLIDINGNIVYDHIGEGAYEETEMKIQELLRERKIVLGEKDSNIDDSLASSKIPAIVIKSNSPETYFGSKRNEYLTNGVKRRQGEQSFHVPENLKLNALYLDGSWNITSEHAETVSDEARIIYKYQAKNVYLVADADSEVEVEVWQDGKPIDRARGVDVNTEGKILIKESRLYKMINNDESGEHTLEFRIKGKGLRVYAFTFG
jgi:thiol-disulfide isomerase/thioredoxin